MAGPADGSPRPPGWWKLTTATFIGFFLALVGAIAAVAGMHYGLQAPGERDWRDSVRTIVFPKGPEPTPKAERPIVEVPEKAFPRPRFTVEVPEKAVPEPRITVETPDRPAAEDRYRVTLYYRNTSLSGNLKRIQLINPHTTIKGLVSYQNKDDVMAVTDRTYVAGHVTGPVTGDDPEAPVTRLKTEEGMMVCNNCKFEKIETPEKG